MYVSKLCNKEGLETKDNRLLYIIVVKKEKKYRLKKIDNTYL